MGLLWRRGGTNNLFAQKGFQSNHRCRIVGRFGLGEFFCKRGAVLLMERSIILELKLPLIKRKARRYELGEVNCATSWGKLS